MTPQQQAQVLAPDADLPLELEGGSPLVGRALEQARQAAEGTRDVLLIAEAGLDATAVARFIHARNGRVPFVALDCAAADAEAVERELFGQSARSERDAGGDLEPVGRDGLIAQARAGTLFLAGVIDLPASAQRRLARLLRDREVRLMPGAAPAPLEARVIASASPEVDREVEDGRFRADLLRRLGGFRIEIPALRQRPADLPRLIARLLERACGARGLKTRTLTPAASTVLSSLRWDGNLRELESFLDRLLEAVPGGTIRQEDVLARLQLDGAGARLGAYSSLRDARLRFEREYIEAVLEHHRWQMSEAAKTLGIQRPNLYRKTRQLGIRRLKRGQGS